MKKKLLVCFIALILFLTGCGKTTKDNVVNDLKNKINNLNSYYLEGKLELINNSDSYTYDVKVSYKKQDLFKVNLKNTINNHEQIILRNKEGVYVLTPSLNKSFKFQSEWPYNSSQTYLLQTLSEDIEQDSKKTFVQENDNYIITAKANYLSNPSLTSQKIYFNNNKDVYKVEVYDENNTLRMLMNISKIEYNPNLEDNLFELKVDNANVESKTGNIDEKIYPMYVPENTYLSNETKVLKENGERIMMTFSGDNPFTIVKETIDTNDKGSVVLSNGEPYLLASGLAVQTDNSLEWINNGVSYYITSSKLTSSQLLEVAESLNVMPVGK